MRICRGLTLIELMVTIAIAAILLALGVPSFIETFANNRVRVQTDDMMVALALARSEAIKKATRVTVCKSSDRTSCTAASSWNQGWIIITDGGTEGVKDGTDQILRVFEGNASVAIAPPSGQTNFSNYVSYLPSGVSDGSSGGLATGTIQFCGTTTQDRQIVVGSTGRPRVESTSC